MACLRNNRQQNKFRETGIGMRTVLLRRPPAVPVRQDVCGAGQPVFDPLGVCGHRLRVEPEELALDVDPGLAIPFELGADGAVVQVLWWSRVLQLSEYPVQSGLPRIGWPGGVGAWLRRL